MLVAIGILGSRLAGLVRQRLFAHYFGVQSDAADAFSAAFRIPNVLQNLFGEGALSASFIPIYAAALARGDEREADRVAGTVGAMLALATAVLVLAGVLLASPLTALLAPGFTGPKRDLTVTLVRVLFPGMGLLVLSAWCLGILNSHRRFLLSYLAPVVWNAAMIATLVGFGGRHALPSLAVLLAWGSVVGSALQFLVQLPVVLRLAPALRPALDLSAPGVRTVLRNFVPAFVSRGVVQISGSIDGLVASLLPTGAVAGLTNAQALYTLPVSLFGMSISAAELPAMSGAADARDALRARLDVALRQIAFFVVPSAMAFLVLGDVIAGALLQTGRFTRNDAVYVWAILAGSAVGLLATTLARVYSSAYFALHDTRTPLRFACMRVLVSTTLGAAAALLLPELLGLDRKWGVAGLTMAGGLAGWIELFLLRRTLNERLGRTGIPASLLIRLWMSAVVAAAAGWTGRLWVSADRPVLLAMAALIPYGVSYLALTLAVNVPEARLVAARVKRRLGKASG
jgi:putative peptidoglycan lipid II flippase